MPRSKGRVRRPSKAPAPRTGVSTIGITAAPLLSEVDQRAERTLVDQKIRAGTHWYRRIDFYYGVLLLTPFLVLIAQTDPIFTQPGTIDPWVYLGFFRNLLNFKGELFSGTYYGSRLSWIIPGYVFHHIFSPLAAAFLLHFAVYLTALLSLYFILKTTLDRRTALLGSFAFAFYPFAWAALGWDYVDGVGIAYYLLTTAFLTRATSGTRQNVFLAAAGAAFAALLYSNLVWVLFTPPLALHYLWLKRPLSIRSFRVCCGQVCLWGALGAGAVTASLGFVNWRLDGNFWFYSPSIFYALGNVNLPNPWYQGIIVAGQLDPWLVVPSVILVTGLLSHGIWLGRRRPNVGLLYFLEFVLIAVELGYWQYIGSPVLGVSFYASYLIPVTYLAAGPLVWTVSPQLSDKKFYIAGVLTAVFLALPWWLSHFSPLVIYLKACMPWLAMVCCLALCLATVGRDKRYRFAFCLGVFVLLYFSVGYGRPRKPFANQARYSQMMKVRDRVEANRKNGRIRWWYAGSGDANSNDFVGISSTYLWGYTLASYAFPEIPKQTNFVPPSLLAVASSRPDTQAVAMGALAPLMKAQGLTAVVREVCQARGLDSKYYVVLIEIQKNSPFPKN